MLMASEKRVERLALRRDEHGHYINLTRGELRLHEIPVAEGELQ
jgi:hypothetical protein